MTKKFTSVFCVLAALCLALVLGSCSGSGTSESGSGSGAVSVPSDATVIYDASSNVTTNWTLPTWQYTAALTSGNGSYVLGFTYNSYSYATATYTPTSTINLSGKTLYVVMKGADTLNTTTTLSSYSDIKFTVGSSTSDTTEYRSEYNNLLPHDDTQYVVYSADLSSFWNAYKNGGTNDKTTNACDLTSVAYLEIDLQEATYDFSIASIYYK
jgi:hypothetical protein